MLAIFPSLQVEEPVYSAVFRYAPDFFQRRTWLPGMVIPTNCTLRLASVGEPGHDGTEIALHPAAADHFGHVIRRSRAGVYDGRVSDARGDRHP